MDSGTGSVLISSRRDTRWLGETCLGFSGSLSDCSGSVGLVSLLTVQEKVTHVTRLAKYTKMYEM